MECHKCPHREDVEAGKYAKTPFRRTPCGKCELRELSVRTIEVDRARPVYVPGHGDEAEPTYEMVPFPEETDAPEAKVPMDVMEMFVSRLLTLPQEVRDVVCWRFMGMEYPEIARKQGITSAGAEARHERAMRLFPELRELFILKTVRHNMRHGVEPTASVTTKNRKS